MNDTQLSVDTLLEAGYAACKLTKKSRQAALFELTQAIFDCELLKIFWINRGSREEELVSALSLSLLIPTLYTPIRQKELSSLLRAEFLPFEVLPPNLCIAFKNLNDIAVGLSRCHAVITESRAPLNYLVQFFFSCSGIRSCCVSSAILAREAQEIYAAIIKSVVPRKAATPFSQIVIGLKHMWLIFLYAIVTNDEKSFELAISLSTDLASQTLELARLLCRNVKRELGSKAPKSMSLRKPSGPSLVTVPSPDIVVAGSSIALFKMQNYSCFVLSHLLETFQAGESLNENTKNTNDSKDKKESLEKRDSFIATTLPNWYDSCKTDLTQQIFNLMIHVPLHRQSCNEHDMIVRAGYGLHPYDSPDKFFSATPNHKKHYSLGLDRGKYYIEKSKLPNCVSILTRDTDCLSLILLVENQRDKKYIEIRDLWWALLQKNSCELFMPTEIRLMVDASVWRIATNWQWTVGSAKYEEHIARVKYLRDGFFKTTNKQPATQKPPVYLPKNNLVSYGECGLLKIQSTPIKRDYNH